MKLRTATLATAFMLVAAWSAHAKDGGETPTPWRGMSIQFHRGVGALATYRPMIEEVSELGANTLLLSAAAYMEHASSQAIYIDAQRAPSRDDMVALIREARGRGMHTVIMPIILLRHPRGSEWRGVIDPPNWERWWQDYRDVIRYFAGAAKEGGADAFIVGSELVSSEKYVREWEETIEAARSAFPEGMIGYSANWDHYKPVQFWEKLDFVGMTSYYTLADRWNPTVEEIVQRWGRYKHEIAEWRRRIDKPLLLTEVGWCSQEGAATAPWNYYQNMKATPAGHEEQRRLYEAFLKVWDGEPGLLGVCWWEWTNTPGGPGDYNYTPKNKPAEAVLRRWFSEGSSKPPEPGEESP